MTTRTKSPNNQPFIGALRSDGPAVFAVRVQDGIATVTWDDPSGPVNLLTGDALRQLDSLLAMLATDDSVRALVITSGKRGSFVVGGDLSKIQWLMTGSFDAAEFVARTAWVHGVLRRIETCPKPVVAALNGTTLGGGYELALACHRRIASNHAKMQIGLPEAQMGLMPGAGGTQRLPRLIGVEKAIGLLLEGKQLGSDKALALGMVDAVANPDDLLAAACAAAIELASAPTPVQQPWDRRGFTPPGGGVQSPRAMQVLMGSNAMVHAKTGGNFPHARAILSAVHDGLRLPIERGCAVESRLFAELVRDPVPRAMLRTLYFEMQDARKGKRRPAGYERRELRKIGVLGAGLMGGGIAFVCANAGLSVVLLDRDAAAAAKGKDYSASKLQRWIKRGRTSAEQAADILARIEPTADYADLQGCDLVVEAVFEDRGVKKAVHTAAEAQLNETAIIGSNTSTLPISGLAEAVQDPSRFIGMHFFSPVERMPLLEVIRGRETSDATLAMTFDFAARIGKTVIVVNDSRGFYTSRVFGTYITEGCALLAEGVAPALIENAGRRSGMPMAPLALADEVGLGLMHQVGEQTRRDLGDGAPTSAATPVLQAMVVDSDRAGRRAGAGFYEYGDGGDKRLWAGLGELFPRAGSQPTVEQVVQRLLLAQALEAARCVQDGVIVNHGEADVGAILGWGFAPWTGGPLSWLDTLGLPDVVRQADALAVAHGERFKPPQLLRDMAAAGDTFHGA